VASNVISSSLVMWFLFHEEPLIRLSLSRLRLHAAELREIFSIGAPAGLQGMMFSLSNVAIQTAINSLGENVIAASAAAFNVEIFVYYITNGFGQACTTFVGQNYGAHDLGRCKKVMWVTMAIDMVVTMSVALGILSIGEFALSLFNTDAAIIEIGMVRLRYLLCAQFLSVILEVLPGALRGFEYSLVPAILTFVGVCGTRITWIYTVFPKKPEFATIMVIYPISWAVTAVAIIICYVVFLRRLEKRIQ